MRFFRALYFGARYFTANGGGPAGASGGGEFIVRFRRRARR